MPDLRERDMWGMSLIDQMICRIQFRQATYHGIYTPPTTETRWIQYPSYNGGSDWGAIAVDPRRGVIIANYSDLPNYNRLVPRDEATRRGWAPRIAHHPHPLLPRRDSKTWMKSHCSVWTRFPGPSNASSPITPRKGPRLR